MSHHQWGRATQRSHTTAWNLAAEWSDPWSTERRDTADCHATPKRSYTTGRNIAAKRSHTWNAGRRNRAHRNIAAERNDRLIVGAGFTMQNSHTAGFSRNWVIDSDGFTVGPYIGYRLSSAWTINGSMNFGWSDDTQHMATFRGAYPSQQYSTSVSATRQYALGKMLFRPNIDVFYSYNRSGAHDFSGSIAGIPMVFNAAASASGYGMTELSMEINHPFRLGSSTILGPVAG